MSSRQLEPRILPRTPAARPGAHPPGTAVATRLPRRTFALLTVTGAVVALLWVLLAAALPARAAAPELTLKIDRSAWAELRKLLAEKAPATPIGAERYGRVWQAPAYASLSKVTSHRQFSPGMLTSTATYVFDEDQKQQLPKRNDLVDNFFYLKRNLTRVDGMLARLDAAKLSAQLQERLAPFVRPGELPDSITVHVLAMAPEIKYAKGRLWVDAGLAAAAGEAQLPDVIAAVLYREIGRAGLSPEPRGAPLGGPALRATFDRLLQEGIAAWLERFETLELDPSHPAFSVKPENRIAPFVRAQEILSSLQLNLRPLLKNKADLESRSLLIDDLLRGSGGYPILGYAMVSLVEDTYGAARLHEISRDSEAFLRAYQEASRKRPPDLVPHEVDPVRHGMNNLPPFDSKDFSQLMKIVQRKA